MQSFLGFLAALIRFAGLALTLAGAAGAVLSLGGRFSDRLDVATHFAPYWLMLALAGLAVWLIGGGRNLSSGAPLLGGIAVVACAWLMVPEFTRPRSPPAAERGETLKIIQFNLWGRAGTPQGMEEWLLAQDADILVFQEAFARSGGVARALREKYPYQTTCAHPSPCSTMILSRLPPVRQQGLGSSVSDSELVGALATYRTERGEFSVVGVHYTWPIPTGPQQQQSLRLGKVLAGLPKDTTIVAGDMNSTPWSYTLKRQDKRFGLERRTRGLMTWPAARFSRYRIKAPFPFLAIDQVYAGSAWRTVSVTRGPELGSDHYPVVVVLRR